MSIAICRLLSYRANKSQIRTHPVVRWSVFQAEVSSCLVKHQTRSHSYFSNIIVNITSDWSEIIIAARLRSFLLVGVTQRGWMVSTHNIIQIGKSGVNIEVNKMDRKRLKDIKFRRNFSKRHSGTFLTNKSRLGNYN